MTIVTTMKAVAETPLSIDHAASGFDARPAWRSALRPGRRPASRDARFPATRAFDSDRAAWQAIAVCLGWSAMIVAAHHTRTGPVGHRTALILHLVSLAVGFGTVLAVDACGLAVLTGRRTIAWMLRFSARADALIWAGFTGLGVSGVFLDPKFGNAATLVNLYAVLVVGLNGVYAGTVRDRLPVLADDAGVQDLPRSLLLRALGSGLLSQAAWWTSIMIGTFAS